MKDKTHSMNMAHGGSGAVNGYEKLSTADLMTERQRKTRQLEWANLEDNKALMDYENVTNADSDFYGGFLPRNNYEDRY